MGRLVAIRVLTRLRHIIVVVVLNLPQPSQVEHRLLSEVDEVAEIYDRATFTIGQFVAHFPEQVGDITTAAASQYPLLKYKSLLSLCVLHAS